MFALNYYIYTHNFYKRFMKLFLKLQSLTKQTKTKTTVYKSVKIKRKVLFIFGVIHQREKEKNVIYII